MFARLFRVSQSIAAGAIVLGLFSLFSRVLGLVRDRLLASTFGAGPVLDAYYAAFRIPDFVFNIIVLGALSAGFIPIFAQLWEENQAKAWRMVQAVLMFVGGGLLVLCAVLYAAMPAMIGVIAPGFDAATTQLAVNLSRVMLLSPFLMGISAVFGGVLQSFRRFLAYSLAPVLYNLGIIAGIVFLAPTLGPVGLAWGVVAGAGAHVLLQMTVAARSGWKWQWVWPWRETGMADMAALMGPRTIAIVLNEASLFIVTLMASGLVMGSLTMFNFAHNLAHVPIGLFGISFAVAAFPELSTAAAQGRLKKFRRVFHASLSSLLAFLLPTLAVFIVFHQEIVRLLLGAGKFAGDEIALTSAILLALSGHMLSQSLIPLYVRNYYARKNTWYPLLAAAFGVALNAGLAYVFSQRYGVVGLALSLSVASAAQWLALIVGPRPRVVYRLWPELRSAMRQSMLGAALMLAVIWSLRAGYESFVRPIETFERVALAFAVVFLGSSLYVLFLRAVGSREYRTYAELFSRQIRSLRESTPFKSPAKEDDSAIVR